MQPPPLPGGPNLRPYVIGEVEDVPGVEAQGAAVGAEEVGELAASTAAGFEEGAGVVVPWEGCFGVAQFAIVYYYTFIYNKFVYAYDVCRNSGDEMESK